MKTIRSNNPLHENNSVILFDGVCNFCNGAVNFIIKRDPKSLYKFAPLQSDIALKWLPDKLEGIPDTLVLVENNTLYYKSTAALRISKKLSGFWPVFYIFILIPAFIRDPVYEFIAKNRYKWFGKKEVCMVPDPSIRNRFL